MMSAKFRFVFSILIVSALLLSASDSFAASRRKGTSGVFGGGSIDVGIGLAFASAEQSGLNGMIDAANAASAASVSKMSTATEYVAYATFAFANGFTELQFRPTMFNQSTSGSGNNSYSLNGYTLFPLVRLIALSNSFIDFYFQGGLGYGSLTGEVSNGTRQVKFSGSAFGAQIGLGSEFCFTGNHCMNVEGNYRYLPIERNIASSGTGPGNLPYGASQAEKDKELEDLNGKDVSTNLSGISGLISYTYHF